MKTEVIVGSAFLAVAIVVVAVFLSDYAFVFSLSTLIVKMTDPPTDWGQATNIYVHYSAIEIHRTDADDQSGWATVVDRDGWIDLSTAINVRKTIGQNHLQPGRYNIIRFDILEAKITIDGQNKTTTTTKGKLNIPITPSGITLYAGSTSELIIDINPKITGSETTGYKLTPAATASAS